MMSKFMTCLSSGQQTLMFRNSFQKKPISPDLKFDQVEVTHPFDPKAEFVSWLQKFTGYSAKIKTS